MVKREHNQNSFGGYLYKLRKERGISFDRFRVLLGVSKAYLNDVETGACRPPTPQVQINMLKILCSVKVLSRDEIAEFCSRAASERDEVPADIAAFILYDVKACTNIRASNDYILYWQKLGL